MPRGVIEAATGIAPLKIRNSAPCSFIYEVSIKSFTQLHPEVPSRHRGTLAGLSHPAMIDHLVRLGVSHVEFMPVAAWIDERHLPPLGLSNAWGYNPVTFMALDPRLAPGGMADLRCAIEVLHSAGIGVLLDVVFNHSGESDNEGATLSLRGLDNASYYAHRDGEPVNITGCGNTLACDREPVVQLVLDSLRHYVRHAGVDGFRFDLAPVLGRNESGFDPDASLLRAIQSDPELAGVHLIAEPWDPGGGGYQLGGFGCRWSEWNDRYRDDVRRFWRGDPGAAGAFATRIAGSSDIFAGQGRKPSAGINFIAAHDGFSLRDLVSYRTKCNAANGEYNRDGHDDNFSWSNEKGGIEQPGARDERIRRDIRALLATLFLSLGTPMLTAGDEFGRTQHGNNNAYAQDNEITWLAWRRDEFDLTGFVARLTALRRRLPLAWEDRFLTNLPLKPGGPPDTQWLMADGSTFGAADWQNSDVVALVRSFPEDATKMTRLYSAFNRSYEDVRCVLPGLPDGQSWRVEIASAGGFEELRIAETVLLEARSVVVLSNRDRL